MSQNIDWLKIVIQAAFIVVPIIFFGWVGYIQLIWTLTEYRPHAHSEDTGENEDRGKPLMVKGIRYPRKGGR